MQRRSPELLTAEELSFILNISEFTIKKLAKTRQLPCKYIDSRPFFNPHKLLRYFQRLEGGAA
jgi:hypothetical protein